ncbi:MAG: hypothetical protein ACLFR5_04065, partial [Halobacteriales archaeon]
MDENQNSGDPEDEDAEDEFEDEVYDFGDSDDTDNTEESEDVFEETDDEDAEDSTDEGEDVMDDALESRDVRDMLEEDVEGEEYDVEGTEDGDDDAVLPEDEPDTGEPFGETDDSTDGETFDDLPEEADGDTPTGSDTDGFDDVDEPVEAGDESEVFEAESDDGSAMLSMGEGDLEGLQDAVESADEVSEFFDARSESSGQVLEEVAGEEVEGFFDAGSELEQEFSESKLETLLSEAKQGVAEFEGLEGYVEHERYWVNKPYAYVAILYSDQQNDYMYHVVEPRLDDFEEAVRKDLEERLRDVLMYEEIDDEMEEAEVLEAKVRKIINDYGIEVDNDSMHKILYYLKRDYIYDGKIDP